MWFFLTIHGLNAWQTTPSSMQFAAKLIDILIGLLRIFQRAAQAHRCDHLISPNEPFQMLQHRGCLSAGRAGKQPDLFLLKRMRQHKLPDRRCHPAGPDRASQDNPVIFSRILAEAMQPGLLRAPDRLNAHDEFQYIAGRFIFRFQAQQISLQLLCNPSCGIIRIPLK